VKVLDVGRARGIFIAAQKPALDCMVSDIKCPSDGLDREFEV
jgi:hypothetical protein